MGGELCLVFVQFLGIKNCLIEECAKEYYTQFCFYIIYFGFTDTSLKKYIITWQKITSVFLQDDEYGKEF